MLTEGRHWTLATRPRGVPTRGDFRLEKFTLPELNEGEVVVRVTYHTVAPGVLPKLLGETYASMVQIGEAIPGNGVGVIEASRNPNFKTGDRVAGELPWATHAVVKPESIVRLDPAIFTPDVPVDSAVGTLGGAGLAAYFGLLRIGQAKPGQTVLVSSASGAVGSVVGQVARIKGCRVIGIAGSSQKCADLVGVLKFDDAIDYRASADLAGAIKATAPEGVDIYFDNVGGEISDASLVSMKRFGRVVVCGQTSDYQRTVPRGLLGMTQVITRRLTLQGFVVHDFAAEFETARREMAGWMRAGLLLHRPTIIEGIENSVDAFVKQFEVGGGGRPLIKVI